MTYALKAPRKKVPGNFRVSPAPLPESRTTPQAPRSAEGVSSPPLTGPPRPASRRPAPTAGKRGPNGCSPCAPTPTSRTLLPAFGGSTGCPLQSGASGWSCGGLSRAGGRLGSIQTDFGGAVNLAASQAPDLLAHGMLMGITNRLFLVIDAFSQFSGTPLACPADLSLWFAKQLLDSTSTASG